MSLPLQLAYIIGVAILIKWAVQFVLWLFKIVWCYVLPLLGFKKNLRLYGDWAVVTGATDGIGKGYARELAKRGLNVILVGRNPDKLRDVRDLIMDESIVKVKTIQFDFAKVHDYSVIEEELRNMDIGILVNNVGTSYGGQFPYQDTLISRTRSMVDVNIVSVVAMTHICLSNMVKKKRGAIIHISSGSSHWPMPYLSVYPASKKFMNHFAEGLQLEASHLDNVHHQVVQALYVSTKMSKKPVSFFIPSAESFAKWAVGTIGLTDVTAGCPSHELKSALYFLIPLPLRIWLSNKVLEGMMKKVK